ncbi:hypothetical protein [Desulfosarcina variabilis]
MNQPLQILAGCHHIHTMQTSVILVIDIMVLFEIDQRQALMVIQW